MKQSNTLVINPELTHCTNLGTQIVTAQNGRWLHASSRNGMRIHQSTSGMDCGANNKGFQE